MGNASGELGPGPFSNYGHPTVNNVDDLSPMDVAELAWSRLNEWFIIDARIQRIGDQTNIDWKTRINKADRLYAGNFMIEYPDERTRYDYAHVQNLVEVISTDLRRMVLESEPNVFCPSRTDRDADKRTASMREAALRSYWKAGRGPNLEAQWALDLAITGVAFNAVMPQRTQDGYPYPFRIDPRGAFPDVLNGNLEDLMVLQRIRVRQAQRMFPTYDLGSWVGSYDDCEILDYYHKTGIIRVITAVLNSEPVGVPKMLQKIRYNLDRPPVAFGMLKTGDGYFRGFFDQIEGILQSQNQLATMMMEYSDQGIYAPWQEYGIQNNTDRPGPDTIYHKIDPAGGMERVSPATSNPQLYEFLDFLDKQARGGGAYPQGRQGEVPQSIASGTFVNSTQGQLTSAVREVQRILADMREQWNEMALEVDKNAHDILGSMGVMCDPEYKKPLLFPVNNQWNYVPNKDLGNMTSNVVTYGAAAGLDYQSRQQALTAAVGANLLSPESAIAQSGDVIDPQGEMKRIEENAIKMAILQKAIAPESMGQLMQVVLRMKRSGKDFLDSLADITEEQNAQAQQGPGQPGEPGPVPTGQEAGGPLPPPAPEGAAPGAAPAVPGEAPPPPNPALAGAGVGFQPSQPSDRVMVNF